jgi:hypothetical protein
MFFGLNDVAFLAAVSAAGPEFDFLDPSNIGQPVEGGFFAGLISHTANGNPTHALIVAPAATGARGTGYTLTTDLNWADETVAVPAHATLINADSDFDGKANTDLMMSLIANNTYSAGAFPAAQFCADLSVGGFTDWYLPARWELDIAYFHLKPTTSGNNTGWGDNPYSVPRRDSKYTTGDPPQTSITAFQSTQAEAFVAGLHWSSAEANALNAWGLNYTTGNQSGFSKGVTGRRVRAFRRIAL